MDDLVLQAMAKWPNVPDCRGWLGLDTRGDWYMRDDATQAAGAFAGDHACAVSKGSKLQHQGLIEFIGRNYASDAEGAWYFQNGPQRVYVELALAPWVLRVDDAGLFTTHTGQLVSVNALLEDEFGKVYANTTLGFGLVHSQDMFRLLKWLEATSHPIESAIARELPQQFGFCLSPAQAEKNRHKAG